MVMIFSISMHRYRSDAARAALLGDYAAILPNLVWVTGYDVLAFVAAVWVFRKKMKG
jgi:hypothetical protein